MTKEIVLITGGNGFVANFLKRKLAADFQVRLLVRKPEAENQYHWDIQNKTIDPAALAGVDHIIHLAGANIFEKRWTDKRKKEIISSRIDSAQLILDTLKKNEQTIQSFVSASAIGYYGAVTTEKIFVETDPPGQDFLSHVVQLWEQAADQFLQQKIAQRVIKIRTAVVFADKNSALQKITTPIKYYVGAPLGSGQQYMPWIHIQDLCAVYEKALKDKAIFGSYNAAAPQHLTNREITQIEAKKLHKPLWLPAVPASILRLVLGEAACMILEGSRVSSQKLKDQGFSFQFETLEEI